MVVIVELFVRWIHMVAAVGWVGGGLFLVVVVAPVFRHNLSPNESLRDTAAIRSAFGVIVRVMVHILLITGAMRLVMVGLQSDMNLSSDYVLLLVIKTALVGLTVMFHIIHVSVFGRKLESAMAEYRADESDLPPAIAGLQRRAHLFAVLTISSGLVVLLMATSLNTVTQ